MLRDIKEHSLNVLDEALRHAIVNNRAEIAVSALDLGASVAAYNIEGRSKNLETNAANENQTSEVKASNRCPLESCPIFVVAYPPCPLSHRCKPSSSP